MIAFLLALLLLQAPASDPCLQGAGGDATPSDAVAGDVSFTFCWIGNPTVVVWTIAVDQQTVYSGPLTPVRQTPSGPYLFVWTPAPRPAGALPIVADGLHTVTVTVAGTSSTPRPFVKRPPAAAPAFNIHAAPAP